MIEDKVVEEKFKEDFKIAKICQVHHFVSLDLD